MDIAEIQKVYASYNLEEILADVGELDPAPEAFSFQAKIEPPSALAESNQIISNISSAK